MKRKILFVLLAALICMTVFTASVFAAETEAAGTESTETESTETVDDGLTGGHSGGDYPYTWTYDPDTYTLTFSLSSGNSECRLYTQGSGKTYGDLAEWKANYPDYANAVQIIYVEDDFTKVGWQHYSSPFANWLSVHTIYLGSIARINTSSGEHSYAGGEDYIRQGAMFYNCPNLKTVYGAGQDKVENLVNLSQLYFPKSYTENKINNTRYLLAECTSVKNVVFPTSIDPYVHVGMFYGCTALESVEIPTWAVEVKDNAFYNCEKLTSITFPANVATISASALTGCTGLTSITFENPELTIPEGMVIPDNENLVINCSSVAQAAAINALDLENESVNLEMSGNFLSDGTGYAYELKSRVLTITKADNTDASLTTLSTDLELSLNGVVNTVIITEDSGITAIADNFFDGFIADTVVIPSTLAELGAASFANMKNLTTVVDYTAYSEDSTAGAGIINLLGITSAADDTFSGSSAAAEVSVYMGKSLEAPFEAFSWFASDTVAAYYTYPTSSPATYFRANNVAFSYLTVDQTGDESLVRSGSAINSSSGANTFDWTFDDKTGVLTYSPGEGYTGDFLWRGYTINEIKPWKQTWRDAVKRIVVSGAGTRKIQINNGYYESPFNHFKNLESIHLAGYPVSKKLNIQFKGGSTDGLFEECPKLTTISFGTDDTIDNVIDLSNWYEFSGGGWAEMFKGCSSITKIIFPATLKDSSSSYDPAVFSGMFDGCTSLTSISIPSYYTKIEANGFANCTNLREITITNADLTIADKTAFPDQDDLVIICASEAQYNTINGFGYEKTKAVLAISGNLLADGTGFAYMLRENHDTVDGAAGYTMLISKATETIGTTLSADNISAEYLSKITRVVIDESTGITDIAESFFSIFPACNTVAIPSTLTTLGAKSFAYLPLLNTVALYNDYYDASFAGEGIIDLRTVTTLASDTFAGSFASVTPTVYLAKTAAISGELDWVSADSASVTVYTYPSGTASGALRASSAENIIHKYYTVEMTGDNSLLREDAAINSNTGAVQFRWFLDETEGKLTITPSAGETASNSSNFSMNKYTTVWQDWKTTWTDVIESIYVVNFGGTQIYAQHQDCAFSNLPNLKHIHFSRALYRISISSSGTNGLFQNCPSLTTVSYGSDDSYDGVIDLSFWKKQDYNMPSMFSGCESIKKVIMPSELTRQSSDNAAIIIANNMFYGCKNLTDIVITEGFGGIGTNAFYGCDKLTKIVIEKPNFDLSSATAETFPANDGLVLHVTSDAVSSALSSLGYTVKNINGSISAMGFEIRYNSYNGLRAIFSFDEKKNDNIEALGYTLKEYGVVLTSASEYDVWGGVDIKLRNGNYVSEATSIKKIPVYQITDEGEKYGKVLKTTVKGEHVDFAGSVVKYSANHKRDIYSCAYVVYTDADGYDYVLYANYATKDGQIFFNLYDVTLDMCLNSDKIGILSANIDEKAVWNTLLQGADTSIRETALNGYEGVTVTLVREYSDSETYIPFVRSEKGVAITDEIIAAAEALIPADTYILGETLAVTIADQGTEVPEYSESIDYAATVTTPNRYPRYQTPDASQKYGAQHLQGMTMDDEGNIYFSLTNMIVKVNQAGEEVGVYKSASEWISKLSMHIGNIYWHEGKIYIGLGISKTEVSGGKRYIGVLDESVFEDYGGYVQDSDSAPLMKAVCIEDISYNKTFTSADGVAHAKFGGGGIDGITVGQLPGKGYILPAGYTLKEDVTGSDGNVYTAGTELTEDLEVTDEEYYLFGVRTIGSYDEYRYDDDNQIIMAFDFDDIVDGENLTPMTYDRVASEYDADIISIKYNMFVYVGYHEYGCQVICYDKGTGDIQLWPYDRADSCNEFPDDNFNVIDGSKKLYMDVVEVGQSVPETGEYYDTASEWATYYTDEKDLDNDGDTSEQLLGWHMTLKCVCGKLHLDNHEEVVYGDTGHAVKYCGARPGLAGDNGCISLGNDYFYVAAQSNTTMYKTDGTTEQTAYGGQARLYRISRYHGSWSFVRVSDS